MNKLSKSPQRDKEARKLSFHKVKTNINGFDSLLYDGLDISSPITIIYIKGTEDSVRALFGLQMIYGIAQSIKDILQEEFDTRYEPYYESSILDETYLNDALLDIIISSSITLLRNKRLSSNDRLTDTFSAVFFDTDDIICGRFSDSVYDFLPDDIAINVDELISQEAVYYSNRTNALHFRIKDAVSDSRNILFNRRCDRISEYFNKHYDSQLNDNDDNDNDDNDNDKGNDNDREKLELGERLMHSISDYVSYNYIPIEIGAQTSINRLLGNLKGHFEGRNLLAIDIPSIDGKSIVKLKKTICSLRKESLKKDKDDNDDIDHKVLIVSLPKEGDTLPSYLADLIIELEPTYVNDYRIDRLSITKSKSQTAALGWHQYKFRDYGFEVYQSLHRNFQVRRYLQRAMVYTHSDVINDTFQQFLMRDSSGYSAFLNYSRKKDLIPEAYVDALYPDERADYKTSHLLSRILLHNTVSDIDQSDGQLSPKAYIHGQQEGVTAIIGPANTFKRFLTFGSMFSCAVQREHTLILLLNKDERMIRRRLSCPARINRDRCRQGCKECYTYIHFMNIMMGCITAEELIHFLQLQLNTSFHDGRFIKRIIIDDLQILDFCFPMLKGNDMFIPALATLCRERDITLHVLCDKDCESANALKAIADNVVCTERDENGKLSIHVDKFAGYQNSPSKVYKAGVKKASRLFECGERNSVTTFCINGKEMEDKKAL